MTGIQMKTMAKNILFFFVIIILAQVSNVYAGYTIISGTWDSNWGKMQFKQSGNNVNGTYATSGGKIYGTLNGNILEGYWTQSSASQRCSTQKYGSYYWGRVKFVFDKNGKFSGTWGYCNNKPVNGGWSGTQLTKTATATISQKLYSQIPGTWNSNWGKMQFKQSGTTVTGTYAASDGKIYGALKGNKLEGYWTQSSSSQRCSTQKYGSYYWGRIKFVFDENGHFSGSWGYCNNDTVNGGWSGTKE